MPNDELNLLKILGLGLTLAQYQEQELDGQTPHYEQEPLTFGCTGCGACCTRPGVVYITPEDLKRLAAHLEVEAWAIQDSWLEETEDGEQLIIVEEDQPCPLYDEESKHCVAHDAKPMQCRTYPFWPELVSHGEAWNAEAAHCPGIGEGKVYQADEIKRLLLGLGRTEESELKDSPYP